MTKTEYQLNWFAANPERRKQYTKSYRERTQNDPHVFVADFVTRIRKSAKKRGIPCDLTKDQLWDLFVKSNGKCAMTGEQLSIRIGDPNRASVDRIDNSKGYTFKNLQITTARVNLVMRDIPKHEFVALCRAVLKTNKGK